MKNKKSFLKEFSKKIIFAMTMLWFAGAFFGGIMVWRTSMDLSSLLDYIGNPMSVGILGYLLKSAFENKAKITTNFESEELGQ